MRLLTSQWHATRMAKRSLGVLLLTPCLCRQEIKVLKLAAKCAYVVDYYGAYRCDDELWVRRGEPQRAHAHAAAQRSAQIVMEYLEVAAASLMLQLKVAHTGRASAHQTTNRRRLGSQKSFALFTTHCECVLHGRQQFLVQNTNRNERRLSSFCMKRASFTATSKAATSCLVPMPLSN